MTTAPALNVASEIGKVRIDLEDALQSVRGSWAADTEQRLAHVCIGLEALLRATSSLSNIVEAQQRQQQLIRGRVDYAEMNVP